MNLQDFPQLLMSSKHPEADLHLSNYTAGNFTVGASPTPIGVDFITRLCSSFSEQISKTTKNISPCNCVNELRTKSIIFAVSKAINMGMEALGGARLVESKEGSKVVNLVSF